MQKQQRKGFFFLFSWIFLVSLEAGWKKNQNQKKPEKPREFEVFLYSHEKQHINAKAHLKGLLKHTILDLFIYCCYTGKFYDRVIRRVYQKLIFYLCKSICTLLSLQNDPTVMHI